MTEQEARVIMNAWSPEKRAAANKAWKVVNDEIVDRAVTRKPRPKIYEVHHESMVAQIAFIQGFDQGDAALAQSMAREAVKLPEAVETV